MAAFLCHEKYNCVSLPCHCCTQSGALDRIKGLQGDEIIRSAAQAVHRGGPGGRGMVEETQQHSGKEEMKVHR